MNPMLHRLLRRDRDKNRPATPPHSDAAGCAGILLTLSVVLAAALLTLLNA